MTSQRTHSAVLRGGPTSLVVRAAESQPALLHWGADLGQGVDVDALALLCTPALPHSSYSVVTPRRPIALGADGWRGRPTLRGARSDGTAWSPQLHTRHWQVEGNNSVTMTLADDEQCLAVELTYQLAPSGVLVVSTAVRNEGKTAYTLAELSVSLPLPTRADEVFEPTGRWCRERSPQRFPLGYGARVRESRHGQTGHDTPHVFAVGTPGFTWRTGEVWAVHLGWSGDSLHWAERNTGGQAAIGTGELLAPGEIVLAPGESHSAPPVYAAYSSIGLDGISDALHAFIRARESHPRRARPVVLNTWEAVYFDHRIDKLYHLADVAAEVGVERFVLDDGWFRGRRDDSAGLGDWYVDEQVWPDGLTPLIAHVRGLGMEFGLWVEPEMISPDSDLFRAHPDWVLSASGRLPLPWRDQQVLDVARPEVYEYLLERLDALLSENDIAFLKWDHNRDILEAGSDGQASIGAKTRAVYRLLDEVRSRHPSVEIESCASGGGRVDLGILARSDRVWASDTNDPLERQGIQRGTALLLPLELIGAHVGPPKAHTTGRTTSLAFRLATAFFGHFGIEWDITTTDPEERAQLAAACAAYKDHRALLATGRVVNGEHGDPAVDVHGVVAADGSEGVFAIVMKVTPVAAIVAPAQLPGLDPRRAYSVRLIDAFDDSIAVEHTPALWVTAARGDGLVVSGHLLATVGLPVPVLGPAQSVVIHLLAQ